MHRRPLLIVFIALLVTVTACAGGVGRDSTSGLQRAVPHAKPATATAPPATEAPPPDTEAPAAVQPAALITTTGIIVPVVGPAEGGWRVMTPCAVEAIVAGGTPLTSAEVVLDPGHGGRETGSVGPNGLVERDLNDVVTAHTHRALEQAGVSVMLTRYANYRVTLQTRAAIATALQPRAFVSIHHNGGHDGPLDRPGTEVYHQVADPESRRLAGLLHEEVAAAFSRYEGIAWSGNVDAGAKVRLNSQGGDYYGILRRSAGVPAVISEGLFLSASMAEAELLARPDVQQAHGEAIARAILRFLTTSDPGSGFVEPIVRETLAGGGGGTTDCVDPPLQ
ncbi:MAG TPA: N-acetylmuramoyl-L-alanine amidase [Acidimicrobiales bacterium]|nr:N-acetylmuramoyl-L-alanine amidase [Acidimicrobiales bacterium]